MKWTLLLFLSIFGFAMAIATVYWIPTKIEPVFWLVIFLICAYIISKQCTEKFFLNGFMVSIFNCVWITAIHVLLYNSYIANHPEMAQMSSNMPLANHPRLMMLFTGPIIGVLSGLVLGLFSFIAGKIVKKAE
jgi:amino acid permease